MGDANVQYVTCIPQEKSGALTSEEQAQAEMPDKFKILNLVKWGWIVAALALFSMGFIAALVCVVAWIAAKWYFKKDINARIKELDNYKAIAAVNFKNKLYKQLGLKLNK